MNGMLSTCFLIGLFLAVTSADSDNEAKMFTTNQIKEICAAVVTEKLNELKPQLARPGLPGIPGLPGQKGQKGDRGDPGIPPAYQQGGGQQQRLQQQQDHQQQGEQQQGEQQPKLSQQSRLLF
ncbi:hypothetical protein O3M35_003008 [Rhynocoris fuscipes]|uniref:Uncharacterized protein n=1 Tax=Rhynocoris fuscipes TaxID=488301 RepID=A0AAW1CPB9_9HEMI